MADGRQQEWGQFTPERTISVPAEVVRAVIHGTPVYFTVVNPQDHIQKKHRRGRFYEAEELEVIRRWCPPGAVFCDIGANVGNHSLYVLKFLFPKEVILFEPNPEAIGVLLSNMGLNGVLDRCDTRHLGYGLSDADADGLKMQSFRNNLGAGRLVAGKGEGTFSVRRGDSFLLDRAPTFMKIDVEGLEMQVLSGLNETVARHRPVIFIEVDDRNRAAFDAWAAERGYEQRFSLRRYGTLDNILLVPKET